MSSLDRFEDIDGWQKARDLTRQVYRATSSGAFAKDYALKDQIRRACVSIMSNIAEGFERGGNKEFAQFLSIAKGPSGEVKSQLYIAVDCGYVNETDFKALYDLATSVGRLIGGFIKYLQSSPVSGPKYRQGNED